MLWLIVAPLFLISFAVFNVRKTWTPRVGFMVALIWGVAGLFIGVIVAMGLSFFVPKDYVCVKTISLRSLRGDDMVQETPFLVCISDQYRGKQYLFHVEGNHLREDIMDVPHLSRVTVVEENQQNGELNVYVWKFKNPSMQWFAIENENKYYEFVIPKGSVKKEFLIQ